MIFFFPSKEPKTLKSIHYSHVLTFIINFMSHRIAFFRAKHFICWVVIYSQHKVHGCWLNNKHTRISFLWVLAVGAAWVDSGRIVCCPGRLALLSAYFQSIIQIFFFLIMKHLLFPFWMEVNSLKGYSSDFII